MARLQGTGKDPLGRYSVDIVFDVPESDPSYQQLIDIGWATALAPEDDPARTERQIAEGLVRGDRGLTNPTDLALAAKVAKNDPYAQVHDAESFEDVVGAKEKEPVEVPGVSAEDKAAVGKPKQAAGR